MSLACCTSFANLLMRQSHSLKTDPFQSDQRIVMKARSITTTTTTTSALGSGRGALPTSKHHAGQDLHASKKKNKRFVKRASFLSQVEKPKPRRRSSRKTNKLLANLDSLADALPDATEEPNGAISGRGNKNVISQKTLPHKPGAMKRKERMEKLERDRFARNMAQMTEMRGISASSQQRRDSPSNRWAALRSFIAQTVEQQPAFQTNS